MPITEKHMQTSSAMDKLFIYTAFTLQAVLISYFALRKWSFTTAMKYGWIVYALAIPALIISIILWRNGKPWSFWVGGILLTAWAVFGFYVDIARPVSWRSPVYLPVLIPYVLLYLSSMMFYWWPVGMLSRPLWFVYAALFAVSTFFNVTSHGW